MKRELGIARCGLACCLCSENEHCRGCNSPDCPDREWCENRRCSQEKGLKHCWECEEDCHKGLLGKIKPYAFTRFVRRYGEEKLLDCLERNEANGIVYHRDGVNGDYDDFNDVEELICFIATGNRKDSRFIGYCGLDCEKCEARQATINNDDELRRKVAAQWSELNSAQITPDMINCTGCRLDGVKTPYCDFICPIRQCGKTRGYDTCGDCDEMDTCEKLAAMTLNNPDILNNLK